MRGECGLYENRILTVSQSRLLLVKCARSQSREGRDSGRAEPGTGKVGQPFDELQDGHQCQPDPRFRRLALVGEQITELLVRANHAQVDIASSPSCLWEMPPGQFSRSRPGSLIRRVFVAWLASRCAMQWVTHPLYLRTGPDLTNGTGLK